VIAPALDTETFGFVVVVRYVTALPSCVVGTISPV